MLDYEKEFKTHYKRWVDDVQRLDATDIRSRTQFLDLFENYHHEWITYCRSRGLRKIENLFADKVAALTRIADKIDTDALTRYNIVRYDAVSGRAQSLKLNLKDFSTAVSTAQYLNREATKGSIYYPVVQGPRHVVKRKRV